MADRSIARVSINSQKSTISNLSRLRVQGVRAFFVEFFLQLDADVVGLHSANRFHHRINPPLHLVLAQFLARYRGVARIVEGEARVPPYAGVNVFRELLARLISARFAASPVEMHELRMGDDHVRGFAFPGVPIWAGAFLRWT